MASQTASHPHHSRQHHPPQHQQPPHPLGRFPFSLGPKKKLAHAEENDEWYIPYNGPVEPPPPKKPRKRDSWGDLVDEYGYAGGVGRVEDEESERGTRGRGKGVGRGDRDGQEGYRESKERAGSGREDPDDIDELHLRYNYGKDHGPLGAGVRASSVLAGGLYHYSSSPSGPAGRASEDSRRGRTHTRDRTLSGSAASHRTSSSGAIDPARRTSFATTHTHAKRRSTVSSTHAPPVPAPGYVSLDGFSVGGVGESPVPLLRGKGRKGDRDKDRDRDRRGSSDRERERREGERISLASIFTFGIAGGGTGRRTPLLVPREREREPPSPVGSERGSIGGGGGGSIRRGLGGGLKETRSLTGLGSGYRSSGATNANSASDSNSNANLRSSSTPNQNRKQDDSATANALLQAERLGATSGTDDEYYDSYYSTLLHRPGSERVPRDQIPDVHPYQQLPPGSTLAETTTAIEEVESSPSNWSERPLLPSSSNQRHAHNTSNASNSTSNANTKSTISRRDFAYAGRVTALAGAAGLGVSRANSASSSTSASGPGSTSGSGSGTPAHARGPTATATQTQTQHPYASPYAFPLRDRERGLHSPHTPHSAPAIPSPHSLLDTVPRLTFSSSLDPQNPHSQRRQPSSADAAHNTFAAPSSRNPGTQAQHRGLGAGLAAGLGLGLGRYLKSSSSTPNLRDSVIAIDPPTAGADGPPPYASPTTWSNAQAHGGLGFGFGGQVDVKGKGKEVESPVARAYESADVGYRTERATTNARADEATRLFVPERRQQQEQQQVDPPPAEAWAPPKGLDRWLSAETWCDALLFPRPRLKLKHERLGSSSSFGDANAPSNANASSHPAALTIGVTGSGRIVSPPDTPLALEFGEAEEERERTVMPSRVLAHSRSLVDLNKRERVDGFAENGGGGQASSRAAGATGNATTGNAAVGRNDNDASASASNPNPTAAATAKPAALLRPPRPKSFAMDDLALPSPVPSLARVLQETALLQTQRAAWQAQATSSFGNKRARSVSRTRAKSLTTRGRRDMGLGHQRDRSQQIPSSMEYLAQQACLGTQGMSPGVASRKVAYLDVVGGAGGVKEEARPEVQRSGTVLTSSSGKASHARNDSLVKTLTKSTGKSHSRNESHTNSNANSNSNSRGHSRNGSWSKNAVRVAKSTAVAMVVCGSTLPNYDEHELEREQRERRFGTGTGGSGNSGSSAGTGLTAGLAAAGVAAVAAGAGAAGAAPGRTSKERLTPSALDLDGALRRDGTRVIRLADPAHLPVDKGVPVSALSPAGWTMSQTQRQTPSPAADSAISESQVGIALGTPPLESLEGGAQAGLVGVGAAAAVAYTLAHPHPYAQGGHSMSYAPTQAGHARGPSHGSHPSIDYAYMHQRHADFAGPHPSLVNTTSSKAKAPPISDIIARHNVPPQLALPLHGAILHPYAQTQQGLPSGPSLSPGAALLAAHAGSGGSSNASRDSYLEANGLIGQHRSSPSMPQAAKMWAQLSPGVVREVLERDLQYSPYMSVKEGVSPREDAAGPSGSAHGRDTLGVGEALVNAVAVGAAGARYRGTPDSGLGMSEDHAALMLRRNRDVEVESELRGEDAEEYEHQQERDSNAVSGEHDDDDAVDMEDFGPAGSWKFVTAPRPPYLDGLDNLYKHKSDADASMAQTLSSSNLEMSVAMPSSSAVPPHPYPHHRSLTHDLAGPHGRYSPAQTSSGSSPQRSPRILGSPHDLEAFQDLFYRPSGNSLAHGTGGEATTLPETPSRPNVDVLPWDMTMSIRARRTGSGLTSLARQLSQEFEAMAMERERDREHGSELEDSQYSESRSQSLSASMSSSLAQRPSLQGRRDGSLQFVFEEMLHAESPRGSLRDPVHAFQPSEQLPEDVQSSRASSMIENLGDDPDDEDHTAVFRLGIVESISTPPAVPSQHRSSFNAETSVAQDRQDPRDRARELELEQHGSPSPTSPHSRITSGLHPPTDATRSSYMTTSTLSRMSGLSDFPAPPKDHHTSILSSYFSSSPAQRDSEPLPPPPIPHREGHKVVFGSNQSADDVARNLSSSPPKPF